VQSKSAEYENNLHVSYLINLLLRTAKMLALPKTPLGCFCIDRAGEA